MKIPGDILDRLQPELYRLASRILKNEDYAKDVVQDVWLEVLTRSNILDLEPYCYKAVRSKCFDILRTKGYYPDLVASLVTVDPELEELLTEIRQATGELPELLQTIFELKYGCDCTDFEIAKICTISTSSVRRRLDELKSRVKARL